MSCLCPRFCLPYQLLPPSHRRLPRRQRLPVHPPSPPRPLRFLQVPAPYSIPRLVPSYDPVIFHLHTLAYHTVETPSSATLWRHLSSILLRPLQPSKLDTIL